MYDKYVGVVVFGFMQLKYNTIINNGYAVFGSTFGILTDPLFKETNIVVRNNIFYSSTVYDYYASMETADCIIQTRYSGSTPNDTDIEEHPLLTENYFPMTKYEGYSFTSPAYLADENGTKHIGARDVNNIKTILTYTSYTFTGNPNHFDEQYALINFESSRNALGD